MTSHSTVSKPGELAREVGQRDREGLLLVEAGDLDDQLHADGARRYRARQTVMARMEGSTLTRPRPGTDSARAEPSPGERGDRLGQARLRAALRWASRSASSSSRPTRSTTPTTRCCGGATCCTGTRSSSTASATRPSTRWRSPRARCCRCFGGVGDRALGGDDPRLVPGAGRRRLPARAGSPPRRWSGAIAAALLLTRFDYPFLAARGYIDIPYMALVVWAAALEAARPRRGAPVLLLLALAGLLRPEAWLLAALYWLWMALEARPGASGSSTPRWPPSARSSGRRRLRGHRRPAVLAALHERARPRTSAASGRCRELPAAIPGFFENLVKLPVLVAAVAGAGARAS